MTQSHSRRSALGLIGGTAAASLAGCLGDGDGGDGDDGGGNGGSDTVRISGGVGPLPMVQVWVDQYEDQSDARFDVSGGGTGVGVSDVLNDQVDIAMMGREPEPEEEEQGLFAVPMLIDTVVGTVNVENPVLDELQSQGLTREDLEAVFTREVTNWGELVDADVDEEIVVYGRADASAAYKKWADFLAGEGDAYTQNDLQSVSDANYNGDQPIAQAVGNEPNAISLNNINYVYDLSSGELNGDIRPVPLDSDGMGLSAEEKFYETRDEFLSAVEAGNYPSPPAREMFLAAKGGFEGPATDFVEYVLTEGQQYVRENGYVPLEQDRLDEALNALPGGS